jgi:hypothetical protein
LKNNRIFLVPIWQRAETQLESESGPAWLHIGISPTSLCCHHHVQPNRGPPWPSRRTGSRPSRGSSSNAAAASVAGPPCHPHCLNPVADSRPHHTHAESPEAVGTELDSTPDSKNQNRNRVKKSLLQNPIELCRFGAQTRDRIGLESKLPMPDPSTYK